MAAVHLARRSSHVPAVLQKLLATAKAAPQECVTRNGLRLTSIGGT